MEMSLHSSHASGHSTVICLEGSMTLSPAAPMNSATTATSAEYRFMEAWIRCISGVPDMTAATPEVMGTQHTGSGPRYAKSTTKRDCVSTLVQNWGGTRRRSAMHGSRGVHVPKMWHSSHANGNRNSSTKK